MSSNKKKPKFSTRPIVVVNVTANLPDIGTALLQTAYDAAFLKKQLEDYLVRSFEELPDSSDILAIQKVLHTKAILVPELMQKNSAGEKIHDFESNQRVDELIVLIALYRSVNQRNKNRKVDIELIPAWQRPNQDEAIKKFSGKGSWDGFLHEYVPLGTEDPSLNVFVMPVEIKSLMINPHKEKYANLNELLDKKTPNFKEAFQYDQSICAVFTLPYVMDPTQTRIPFDLKQATETMNKHVPEGSIGCLLFFGFDDNGDETTTISVKCHFVSREPLIATNGNIEHVDLFELNFGTFKHKK